jgi:fluoroquinolone resistance protein
MHTIIDCKGADMIHREQTVGATKAEHSIAADDYHEDYEFTSINFSGITIAEKSFQNCSFISCNFRDMAMSNATFRSCVFQGCDIVLAKMYNVTLNDVAFVSCKIMGINFSECNSFEFFPEFRECIINNSVFNGVSLKKGTLRACRLVDCDCSDSDFREADFRDTYFEHVSLHNCHFEKADFRNARGYSIDPKSNNVNKAVFCLPEAQSFLRFLGIKIEN